MTVRLQVAQPQPPAIVTIRVGTKVRGGVHGPRTPMGGRQRSRPERRRGSGLDGLMRTQRTKGLVRQARKRFGLAGAGAAGWRG